MAATATPAGAVGILVGLALCALLEDSIGLGIVVPAETVVIGAAAAAAAGLVPLWAVFLVAWVFGAAGDVIGFLIGRRWGDRLIDRYGGRVHLTPERVQEVDGFIVRWGGLGVAGGRLVPAVRILVMPVAGAAGMPLRRFVVADAVGVAAWAAIHVVVGYLAGRGIASVDNRWIALGVLGLVGAAAVLAVIHHHQRSAARGRSSRRAEA